MHLLKLDKTSDVSYSCMLQSPVNQLQYDNNVEGEDNQTHGLELTNSVLEFRCNPTCQGSAVGYFCLMVKNHTAQFCGSYKSTQVA